MFSFVFLIGTNVIVIIRIIIQLVLCLMTMFSRILLILLTIRMEKSWTWVSGCSAVFWSVYPMFGFWRTPIILWIRSMATLSWKLLRPAGQQTASWAGEGPAVTSAQLPFDASTSTFLLTVFESCRRAASAGASNTSVHVVNARKTAAGRLHCSPQKHLTFVSSICESIWALFSY